MTRNVQKKSNIGKIKKSKNTWNRLSISIRIIWFSREFPSKSLVSFLIKKIQLFDIKNTP